MSPAGPTLAAMADAMELEVLGKRESLRICSAKAARGRWPRDDVARKQAALLIFEAIARDLRERATAQAAETRSPA